MTSRVDLRIPQAGADIPNTKHGDYMGVAFELNDHLSSRRVAILAAVARGAVVPGRLPETVF